MSELQAELTSSRGSAPRNALAARRFWDRFRSERPAIIGLAIVAFVAILAIFPERFAPYSPTETSFPQTSAPSWQNPMGTDDLGRDVLSRVVFGTRVVLIFGVLAAAISFVVGSTLGLIAGYFGGWVDTVFSRSFEVVLMIPAFFLLVVVVAFFGNDLTLEIWVVGLTIWPANARIMRASVLSLKERPFVRASIATGASGWRTMVHHLLPNAIQPVIANSNLQVGMAIMFEAGMAFLGLGDPEVVSWGQMVNRGALFLANAWWLAFFPGVCLAVVILSFNLIGGGLGAVYGPRALQAK